MRPNKKISGHRAGMIHQVTYYMTYLVTLQARPEKKRHLEVYDQKNQIKKFLKKLRNFEKPLNTISIFQVVFVIFLVPK
ncbi:hypothetical protein BpHYR1_018046 [Brachionus plicatilis]|uniref:Uncharacterized protein n=1 Tax=Brachionus plicatilis TaxID=10195 RepID=A0A3M7RQ88_BRAPC|nr:hypothetical protein BpHYR1_018046 [Brachionus plicatilis]